MITWLVTALAVGVLGLLALVVIHGWDKQLICLIRGHRWYEVISGAKLKSLTLGPGGGAHFEVTHWFRQCQRCGHQEAGWTSK